MNLTNNISITGYSNSRQNNSDVKHSAYNSPLLFIKLNVLALDFELYLFKILGNIKNVIADMAKPTASTKLELRLKLEKASTLPNLLTKDLAPINRK